MLEPQPIPQWYRGVHFRSTLEARWALFFDRAGMKWDYETEGYVVGGRAYRPDFLLPDAATWVEVKGDPRRLDVDLMIAAAQELPRREPKRERGPRIMILGSIPAPPSGEDYEPDRPLIPSRPLRLTAPRNPLAYSYGFGDWGWIGLNPTGCTGPIPQSLLASPVEAHYYGFGQYEKNLRPWWIDWADDMTYDRVEYLIGDIREYLMTPKFFEHEPGIPEAYAAARAQRFGRALGERRCP